MTGNLARRPTAKPTGVALLALAALASACATHRPATPAHVVETIGPTERRAVEQRSRRVVAVRIDGAAIVHLDGRPVSLDELESAFADLSRAGGLVRYTRDNPAEEPPPEVAEMVDAVIRAIIDAGVTVELVEGDLE